jgi:recombination protein RecT|nr:MAG TPA: RecT protein [Caudoviricetes sp.]
MANNNLPQLKATLNAPSVKAKFEEMLGKRAPQFMTSITSVVGNNALLQKADVNSIVMGAATAASMDLPLNPNLGYAALVPFNSKDGCFAQLQIMTKGYVELFIRSGQCKSLICEVVRKGELVKKNKFTGEYVFDESKRESDEIIGVMSAFELVNGYKKVEYMTVQEVKDHAQKFSQAYRRNAAIWKDNWEEMMKKSCLKRLLVRWAPKSIEMQQMVMFDQAVVKGDISDMNSAQAVYADNGQEVNAEQTEHVEDAVEVDENGNPIKVNKVTGEIIQPNREDNDF